MEETKSVNESAASPRIVGMHLFRILFVSPVLPIGRAGQSPSRRVDALFIVLPSKFFHFRVEH